MAHHGYWKDYQRSRAVPLGGEQPDNDAESARRSFHRPFAMAHGHAVILSAALARTLPRAPAVVDFMRFYAHWISSKQGRRHAGRIRRSHKCFIGGDVTMGAWVGAIPHAPLVAVDLLSFNMMWPWPLYNRSFGQNAVRELHNLHAFHLFGAAAADPRVWMHLHNVTTVVHEAELTPPRAVWPRLRCRHARHAQHARELLDRWIAENVSQRRQRAGRWLERASPPTEAPAPNMQWLFCGITCLDQQQRANCQREWAGI